MMKNNDGYYLKVRINGAWFYSVEAPIVALGMFSSDPEGEAETTLLVVKSPRSEFACEDVEEARLRHQIFSATLASVDRWILDVEGEEPVTFGKGTQFECAMEVTHIVDGIEQGVPPPPQQAVVTQQRRDVIGDGYCVRLEDEDQHGYVVRRPRNTMRTVGGQRVPALEIDALQAPPLDRLMSHPAAKILMHQIADAIAKASAHRPKRVLYTGMRYRRDANLKESVIDSEEQIRMGLEIVRITEAAVAWTEERPPGGEETGR